MNNLSRLMQVTTLNPALLRLQAQQLVRANPNKEGKPCHHFAYAYAFLAVKKLFPRANSEGFNREALMMKHFALVTQGLTPQEQLDLFEALVFMFGVGHLANPWLDIEPTLRQLSALPSSVRWRGLSDPEHTLTLYRGVCAHSEESARDRHLRPLWANLRAQALFCCVYWLDDNPGETPLLAKAKVKLKDVVAILEPSSNPYGLELADASKKQLEVVLSPNGLFDLEITVPTLAEIEGALRESRSLYKLPPSPSKTTKTPSPLVFSLENSAKIF